MGQNRKYKEGELFVLETKFGSQGKGTEKKQVKYMFVSTGSC